MDLIPEHIFFLTVTSALQKNTCLIVPWITLTVFVNFKKMILRVKKVSLSSFSAVTVDTTESSAQAQSNMWRGFSVE